MFAKFRELQSARRLMRYLDRNGLSLPARPLLGPSPHEIVWRAQIVHASLAFFKIRPMLGRTFMADGKRIRADAGRDR